MYKHESVPSSKSKTEAKRDSASQAPSPGTSTGVSYTPGQIKQLQKTIGNRAVTKLLQAKVAGKQPIQRALRKWEDIQETGNGLDWESHRQTISGGKTKAGNMTGWGADVQNGKSLTTDIDWGAPQGKMGKSMNAKILGPDHSIGSEPSGDPKKEAERFNGYVGIADEYIAGHLLNHHLGGSGKDVRNVTPMPRGFNSKFESEVENVIKSLVNDQHGYVSYSVAITYQDDSFTPDNGNRNITIKYPAALVANWHQLNEDGAALPGTAGQWSSDMAKPSDLIDDSSTDRYPNMDDTQKNLPTSGTLDGAAAKTTVAFDEVVLTGPEVLRKQWAIKLAHIELMRTNQEAGREAKEVIDEITKVLVIKEESVLLTKLDEAMKQIHEKILHLQPSKFDSSMGEVQSTLIELKKNLELLDTLNKKKELDFDLLGGKLVTIKDAQNVFHAFRDLVQAELKEYVDKTAVYRMTIQHAGEAIANLSKGATASLLDVPGSPISNYTLAQEFEPVDSEKRNNAQNERILRLQAFTQGKHPEPKRTFTIEKLADAIAEYATWIHIKCENEFEQSLHMTISMGLIHLKDPNAIAFSLQGFAQQNPAIFKSYCEKVNEKLMQKRKLEEDIHPIDQQGSDKEDDDDKQEDPNPTKHRKLTVSTPPVNLLEQKGEKNTTF